MGNCIGLGLDTSSEDRAFHAQLADDSFVDVLFFPDRAMPCKNFRSEKGCTRKNCKSLHDEDSSLLKFLRYLAGAKRTMDVCVFTITCDEVLSSSWNYVVLRQTG